MAAIKLTFWRKKDTPDSHTSSVDSIKARKALHEAYNKSGGPTTELKRVYGEYLGYKRARATSPKN
jgi:hypothetical protein